MKARLSKIEDRKKTYKNIFILSGGRNSANSMVVEIETQETDGALLSFTGDVSDKICRELD